MYTAAVMKTRTVVSWGYHSDYCLGLGLGLDLHKSCLSLVSIFRARPNNAETGNGITYIVFKCFVRVM